MLVPTGVVVFDLGPYWPSWLFGNRVLVSWAWGNPPHTGRCYHTVLGTGAASIPREARQGRVASSNSPTGRAMGAGRAGLRLPPQREECPSLCRGGVWGWVCRQRWPGHASDRATRSQALPSWGALCAGAAYGEHLPLLFQGLRACRKSDKCCKISVLVQNLQVGGGKKKPCIQKNLSSCALQLEALSGTSIGGFLGDRITAPPSSPAAPRVAALPWQPQSKTASSLPIPAVSPGKFWSSSDMSARFQCK